MNGEARRYLRRATRGLFGRQRQAVAAELRGHIEARVSELMLGGLDETEATRATLGELGAPAAIAGGMARVHSVPPVLRGALGLALAATALLTVLPHGLAQVQSVFGNMPGGGATGYLDLEQLRTEVQKAGGRLVIQHGVLSLDLPGVPNSWGQVQASWPGVTLSQNGRAYLAVQPVLAALQASGIHPRVSGWNEPVLTGGPLRLQLQTGGDRRLANELYQTTLDWSDLGGPDRMLNYLEPNGATEEAALTGHFTPGQVYALVTPTFNDWYTKDQKGNILQRGNIVLTVDTTIPDASGQLKLRRYNTVPAFTLVSDVATFQRRLAPYQADQTKLHQWTSAAPAPALLLRLSGHFGADAYTVVPASQVRVQDR